MSGALWAVAMTTGADQVLPPSVDLENFRSTIVFPQSPLGLLVLQYIQVRYTVPSGPMARSVNWSILGTVCVASTATRAHVVPPSQEWATLARDFVRELLKSVQLVYRQFTKGLVALWSASIQGLSTRPPSNGPKAM